MVESVRITDPSLLQEFDITTSLSGVGIDTSKPSLESTLQTQETKLVLLQPLAKANTLQACRNPNSRLVRTQDGSVCGTSDHEFLNIRPLGKAWRQALMKVPPISHLTFDLALPKEDEMSKDSLQKVYWDTAMPRGAGLGIYAQHVMTLAITIATVTRMRADADMQFDVTYDEGEGVSLKAMTLLKKQLRALAEAKVPVVKDGEPGAKVV